MIYELHARENLGNKAKPGHYEWDDWDPYDVVGEPSEDLVNLLEKLSYRAVVEFSIGCAEWVIAALADKSNQLIGYEYLEASWACSMFNYFEAPEETESEEWEGPIRGPLNLAMMGVLNTIYSIEDESPEGEAALIDRVVLHILADHEAYLCWRGLFFEQLLKVACRKPDEPLGEALAYPVLMLESGCAPLTQRKLIDETLHRILRTDNRFLISIGG